MNKKWSKKKKITTAILVVLVLALVAAVLYIALKPEDPIKTQFVEVTKGDITETFDTTAIVISAHQGVFPVYDGIVVKEVNVRVGDNVKAGDVLATFDTTALNTLLTEKREAYNVAQAAYDEYLNNAYSASTQLKGIESQITSLEGEIKTLEDKIAGKDNTSKATTENAQLEQALKDVLGDNDLATRIINRLLSTGNSSQMSSILTSILGSGSFDSSALDMITSSMLGDDEKLLLEKELQLVQLKVQAASLSVQSADALKEVYKTIADSAYSSYESLAQQVNILNKGWIAEEDGFVREVNIKAGEVVVMASSSSSPSFDISSILASVTSGNYDITSILSSFVSQSKNGMIVEYYPLEAKFEIGKHDISKIYMDQKVKVITVDGKEFTGTVNYISAVAEGSSSGLDINSLMGSSSGASNTLTAKVEIENADRSVIIGLDVDVTADLRTKKDTLLIPVESIQNDSETGFYVFKYDEANKKLVKTPVVVGLSNDEYFEILEGLELSDKIVRAPTMTMKDGQSAVPA